MDLNTNIIDKLVADSDRADRIKEVARQAKDLCDKEIWPMVSARSGVNRDRMRSRDLFNYALLCCATGEYTRLESLFNTAREMQRSDGHFWWFWGDRRKGGRGCDRNAVEFCTRAAGPLYLWGSDFINDPLRNTLREILDLAGEACLRRRVPRTNTNIALMNAMNLMLLGGGLGREELVLEGCKRFDQFCIYTWEWGIHEFCSPTYTPVHLECLGLIERFCRDAQRQIVSGNGSDPRDADLERWLDDLAAACGPVQKARPLLMLWGGRLSSEGLEGRLRVLEEASTDEGKTEDLLRRWGMWGNARENARLQEPLDLLAVASRSRGQARALLELFWTDVTHDWLKNARRLGGVHSRVDDEFIESDGRIDDSMWVRRKLGEESLDADEPDELVATAFYQCLGDLDLPRRVMEEVGDRPASLVRRRWGPKEGQCTTHYRIGSVSLSTSGAGYDRAKRRRPDSTGVYLSQDVPLAVDFDVKPESPAEQSRDHLAPHNRCFFIADYDKAGQEEDPGEPYNKKHVHYKPLCWAAAQREQDALGVVLYRTEDLDQLESHFVIPNEVDELCTSNDKGEWDSWKPVREASLEPQGRFELAWRPERNTVLVVRKGNAAAGVRVVWLHDPVGDRSEGQAPVVFYNGEQGREYGACRLTIDHRDSWRHPDSESYKLGGAALWVQIKPEDEEMSSWLSEFMNADALISSSSPDHLSVEVVGKGDVPVRVEVDASLSGRLVTKLEPQPTCAVLEVGGRDSGRRILEGLELIQDYKRHLENEPLTLVKVPGYWEAERGRVWPPMETCQVKNTHRRYVVARRGKRQSHVGSVTWQLDVPASRNYYIWGHVKAPSTNHDSYYVRIYGECISNTILLDAWVTGKQPTWTWVPMDLAHTGAPRNPTPVFLEKGIVNLQLFARESGIKLDGLFITANRSETP